jgi:hypothetical protein
MYLIPKKIKNEDLVVKFRLMLLPFYRFRVIIKRGCLKSISFAPCPLKLTFIPKSDQIIAMY